MKETFKLFMEAVLQACLRYAGVSTMKPYEDETSFYQLDEECLMQTKLFYTYYILLTLWLYQEYNRINQGFLA